jgi:hypothetical protein
MERTIDKTLRKWFEKWYLQLFVVGIKVRIGFSGGSNSVYFNTITLTTVYPNVPVLFDVEVGDTADFYIEHSEVVFKDVSNYLNIIINDDSYGIRTATYSAQLFDIQTTLESWVDDYADILQDFGIYVSTVSNTLIFKVKSQDQRLEYTVQVGKSGLPAEELFIIKNKILGRFGALITSNEILLPPSKDVIEIGSSGSVITSVNTETINATWSFETESFATGQVLGINNTVYPWNNQEYNICINSQNIIKALLETPGIDPHHVNKNGETAITLLEKLNKQMNGYLY